MAFYQGTFCVCVLPRLAFSHPCHGSSEPPHHLPPEPPFLLLHPLPFPLSTTFQVVRRFDREQARPLLFPVHASAPWLFGCQIHTDVGIVGLGEATLEGRSQTVEACIKEIERYLIGKDPLLVERHWQHIYRGAFYRGGPVLSRWVSPMLASQRHLPIEQQRGRSHIQLLVLHYQIFLCCF